MKAGWQTKKLGELCRIRTGKKDVNQGNPEGEYPFFTCAAEHTYSDTFSFDTEALLIAGNGDVGKVSYYKGKFEAYQRTYVVSDFKDVQSRFLYLILDGKLKDTVSQQKLGNTMPYIKVGMLTEFPVPIPPLSEQQRIVGILDEAFDGIATAKANAEQNLQNARALFESHLQSVFTQRGEGWVEKNFEELIESNVIGLTKNSREQGEDKAYPYVKMNNITRDNHFEFSSFTCVEATDEEVSKFSLRNGDFLFNTRNSYELVGKSCIYESNSEDLVLFNNNIMRVRFKNGVDARFVLLAFSSKVVADELDALKSGTTNVSAIYFKDLKSLKIPAPSVDMQKSISAKLELLSAETQRLESLYQRKLAALDELKKSLLHQAFSGQLTDHPTGAARAV